MLDDADLDITQEPTPPEPRRSGNRSFFVIAGILGAIMLLALIGLAVYALVILPQRQAQEQAPTLSNLQQTNTAIARGLQVTSTPTRTATSTPTNTNTPLPPTSTNTPVTSLFSDTPTVTQDPATQTVASLLTQAAIAQTQVATSASASPTPGSPTATASALPQSGFGDSSNAPLMVASALTLFVIAFIARRLRAAA